MTLVTRMEEDLREATLTRDADRRDALRLLISSLMVPAESSAWSSATLEQTSAFLIKRAADCLAPHSEYPAEV